ncbi:FadR family transcriptional regulator [Stakelama sp. CBK3Z-3]|uniref:FadR family transcriptional regulator n=1 Tax=Stakelama flava TaxID=2860338 RepID=A0ABS6XKY5_9SPHN|nr:FadR/GntR family transcriptional regulator [Stakelama flava]MBW4330478.1 FadR family transcriptional regulator [Stakelama flava]
MKDLSTSGETRVEHAVRSIRDFIRASRLRVGDELPSEAHFATQLGVSRAVTREAFGALAALRLIDVGNGRRARVGAIDGSVMGASLDHAVVTAQVSMAQIWDVRRTLELRTVELAALHRSDQDAKLILQLADCMAEQHADLEALTQHDIAFHQAIARASGNALFVQIVRSFEGLMRNAVPAAWQTRTTEDQRQSMLRQHREIAGAIADSDPVAASDTMNTHFDTSIGDLFKRL